MNTLLRLLLITLLVLFSASLRSAEAVGSIVWEMERLDFPGGEVNRLYLDYRYSPDRVVTPVHGIMTYTDDDKVKWYTVLYGSVNVKSDGTLFGKLSSGSTVIVFITDHGLDGEIRIHTPPDHGVVGIGRMIFLGSW